MNNIIYMPVLGMPEIKASDNIPELIIECLWKNKEQLICLLYTSDAADE